MRKFLVVVGLLAALAIPATAIGVVDLNPSQVGTTCEAGGTFHFVANGVAGEVGALTATFSGGGTVTGIAPDKTNKGTNHWTIEASGTLVSASATKGDKLVLSNFECSEKKEKK
jgi:hypothetical protein